MSGYLSGLVLLVGPTERIQRSVLVALADSADDGTGYCWPSVRTLANKTLFSTRYVIEAVQQLDQCGWVQVHHRAVKGRYTAYTVDKELLETLRSAQREQEKQRKRSGELASPETYLSDLRKLHDLHLNRVHLTADQPQSDPDEPGSPENAQGEVNSVASEVNSVAVSGEICDTPNKKEKHQDPSEKGCAPLSPDEFPDGLSELQYAVSIFERVSIASSFRLRELCSTAIRMLASKQQLNEPMHVAAQAMEQRIRAAQQRGETINAFWFEDSKWKLDGGPADGTNSSHRGTTAAARVERSLGAWDRARAERDRTRAIR